MSEPETNGDASPAIFDLVAAGDALAASSTSRRISQLRVIDDLLGRQGELPCTCFILYSD
jgi:hypothetical protein